MEYPHAPDTTETAPAEKDLSFGRFLATSNLLLGVHEIELRKETDFSAKAEKQWSGHVERLTAVTAPLIQYTHRITAEYQEILPQEVTHILGDVRKQIDAMKSLVATDHEPYSLIRKNFKLLEHVRTARMRVQLLLKLTDISYTPYPVLGSDDLASINAVDTQKAQYEAYTTLYNAVDSHNVPESVAASRDAYLTVNTHAAAQPAEGIRLFPTVARLNARVLDMIDPADRVRNVVKQRQEIMNVLMRNGFQEYAMKIAQGKQPEVTS